MSFGLKTTPSTFQRAMEITLAGLTFEICLCYLDGVIIFGRDIEEHNRRLRQLERFREFNLKVKLNKCVFAERQVSYLGHVISQQGVGPVRTKVDAVKQIPLPPRTKASTRLPRANWLLSSVCSSICDSGGAVNKANH